MRYSAITLICLALAGCDDQKSSEKVPPVHYYSDAWHESVNTIHDGALRVGAYTFQEGRQVKVRCFRGASSTATPTLDIRYTIEVPLLRRLEKELEASGGITLNVAADDNVARVLKAQVGTDSDALFFLAEADRKVVGSLAGAKEKIFVVPTMKGEQLDSVLEFGAAYAKKHIRTVLEACKYSEVPTEEGMASPQK